MPKVLTNIQSIILISAEALFLNKGFQHTDMREIASHANIAVGTIYHYYKNKESLFMHVMAHSWQQTLSTMEQLTVSNADPHQLLNALLDKLAEDMRNRRSMSSLWTEIAALYAGTNSEFLAETGFIGMHAQISMCFSRTLARFVPRNLSPQEQLIVDRLGNFAFVMSVDLCLLPEVQARSQRRLIVDLLSTYMDKLSAGIMPIIFENTVH
jgi:AcrR family transcriptional regulator